MESLCILCRAPLKDSSSRRTVSPKNSANESVRNFFLGSVCPPVYQFLDGVTQYLCRLSCYKKVEKAAKLHDNLETLEVSSQLELSSTRCRN